MGRGLAGKIIGLVISAGIIIGGLSGALVLRGTESSGALVAVGFIFLAIDIYALATHNKKNKFDGTLAGAKAMENPVSVTILREKSFVGSLVKISFSLNGVPIGDLKNGESFIVETGMAENCLVSYDANGNVSPPIMFAVRQDSPALIVFKSPKFRPESATGCEILSKEQVAALAANAPALATDETASVENQVRVISSPTNGTALPEGTVPAVAVPPIISHGVGVILAVSLAVIAVCGFLLTRALDSSSGWRIGLPGISAFSFFMGFAVIAFACGMFTAASKSERKVPFILTGILAIPYALWLVNNGMYAREIYGMMRLMIFGIPIRMNPMVFYRVVPVAVCIPFLIGILAVLFSLYRKLPKAGRVLAVISDVIFIFNILFLFFVAVDFYPGSGNLAFAAYGSPVLGYLCLAAVFAVSSQPVSEVPKKNTALIVSLICIIALVLILALASALLGNNSGRASGETQAPQPEAVVETAPPDEPEEPADAPAEEPVAESTPTPAPSEEPEQTDANVYGNTNGNLSNGALAAVQGDWVFYLVNDVLFKSKLDGTEETELTDGVFRVSVSGEWVYFIRDNGIYKIRTDGTEETQVCNDNVQSGYFAVADGWIYYGTVQEYDMPGDSAEAEAMSMALGEYGIYKIRVDGTERTQVTPIICHGLNIEGDWIYSTDYENQLRKIRTDGSEETELGYETFSFTVADGWIYYIESISNELYKMKTDGTENAFITGLVNEVNADGDWLYCAYMDYSEPDGESNGVFKIRPDGTERTQLTDERAFIPNIAGEWLHYLAFAGEYDMEYRKVRTDGTDGELLYSTAGEDFSASENSESTDSDELNAEPGMMDISLPDYAIVPEGFPVAYESFGYPFTIEGYSVGTDESGNTMITLHSNQYRFNISAECRFESGGETFPWDELHINLDSLVFDFDTTAAPETITIINGDTKEEIISFAVEDVAP